MARPERTRRPSVVPALWLMADAALAALLAWPAEALLLFLLNPDLAFTPGDFGATMVALLPHALVVYVLAGPLAVLFFTSLSVGRSTRRELSVRYILRFAFLDLALLAAAAVHQFRTVGALLPDLARSALGLTATSLVLAALVALALSLVDRRRPKRIGAPWAVALALGVAVPLTIAGEMRRVRLPDPVPEHVPGFVPTRPLLLLEIPGLDPADLAHYVRRGNTPALGGLLARGVSFPVDGGPTVDPLASHVTLLTGRTPRDHGVLASARFRPTTGDISFGTFPRGLLLRPLLLTPLWSRDVVGARDVHALALPGVAEALGLPVALVGDPLGWPPAVPGSVFVPRARLRPGEELDLGAAGRLTCGQPEPIAFATPAETLAGTPALRRLVDAALAEDLCALAAARAILAGPAPPPFVLARLGGHARVVWQFAGWREDEPARGATEDEIAAYRWTTTRYVRVLDEAIGAAVDAAGRDRFVAVVAPLGVRPRHDLGGLGWALLGEEARTGTFAGPPPGFALLVGSGVRAGREVAGPLPLTGVLPTLLWAQGLPAGEDMGPLVRSAFTKEHVEANPVFALPSYATPESRE